MMLWIALLFTGLLLAFRAECYSQCCAAGNPVNTANAADGSQAGVLGVSVSYMRSYSDTYFQGASVSDYKYIDYSSFDYSMISAGYGLFPDLQLTAELGYFFSKLQKFDFGDGFAPLRKAGGIGDGTLGIVYNLMYNEDFLLGIYPSIKVTLPLGEFDQMDGAVVMPIDIQPSSGSFKYTIGATVSKGFDESPLALLAMGSYEISQRIETDRTNYKYGNQLNISLIGLYSLTDAIFGSAGGFAESISAGLELRYNFREKSSDRDKKLIESTGGSVLFVAPRISFGFKGGWALNAQFDLPVLKDINGIQLTNKNAFTLGFSMSFDLKNSDNEGLLPGEDDFAGNPRAEFRVEGICGMCKSRIENAAAKIENVVFAYWNEESKILTVRYDKSLDISLLKKAIALAGHDNDMFKATDEDYSKLHSCCKYR